MTRNLRLFNNASQKSNFEGYQAEIDRIIDYRKASGKQSLRRRIGNFLMDFKSNLIMNIINSIFSLLLVMQYIYSTYDHQPFKNLAWGITNFMIHTYFLIEYAIRLYIAKDRKQFFYSSDGVIDVATLIPFFIIKFNYPNPLFEYNTESWVNFGNLLILLRIIKFDSCFIFIVKFLIFLIISIYTSNNISLGF